MTHGAAMWALLISLLAGHMVVDNDQPRFDAEHPGTSWKNARRRHIPSIVGDAMALATDPRALERHPGRWTRRA